MPVRPITEKPVSLVLVLDVVTSQAVTNLTELASVTSAITGASYTQGYTDFEAAFDFASTSIQTIFRTADAFERMVRQGYGVMTDPAEMRFLDRSEVAGSVWQRVLFRDASGAVFLFDYQMIETAEGWRIGAVHPVKMPDQLT